MFTMFLSLLGCAPESYTLVGPLGETDALVGISVSGDSALAFVAGGTTTIETHSRWFTDSDLFSTELSDTVQEWEIDASVEATGADGTVTSPDGEVWEFSLTNSGTLFDAVDNGCRDGAVLTAGAGGPLLQGVWCDEEGDRSPVLPVGVVSMEMTQLSVQVETTTGLRAFEMGIAIP